MAELPPVAQAKVARMLRNLPPDWRPVVIGEERSATGTAWTIELIDGDGARAGFFVIECETAELRASGPSGDPCRAAQRKRCTSRPALPGDPADHESGSHRGDRPGHSRNDQRRSILLVQQVYRRSGSRACKKGAAGAVGGRLTVGLCYNVANDVEAQTKLGL